MRTSARNMLRGKVVSVTDGAVNAEVVLDIGNGLKVTAIVTRESGMSPSSPLQACSSHFPGVATDVLPLLVNACSAACLARAH